MELSLSPVPIEPAVCIFCKQGRGANFYISTGVQGPVGFLFICSTCFSEMSEAIGFKHISSVDKVVKDLEGQVKTLGKRVEDYDLLFNTLHNHGVDLHYLVDIVSDQTTVAKHIRDEEDRIYRKKQAQQRVSEQESGSSYYSPSGFASPI